MNLTDYCENRKHVHCDLIFDIYTKAKKKLNIFQVLIDVNDDNTNVHEYRKFDENYFNDFYETYQYLYPEKYYYIWWLEWHLKHFNTKTKMRNSNKRDFVFKRDGYKCILCDTEHNLTVDHIFPISIFNDLSFFNLMTLCESCNKMKKNNIPKRDFIKEVLVPKILERQEESINKKSSHEKT